MYVRMSTALKVTAVAFFSFLVGLYLTGYSMHSQGHPDDYNAFMVDGIAWWQYGILLLGVFIVWPWAPEGGEGWVKAEGKQS